jgi:hypothetical protein
MLVRAIALSIALLLGVGTLFSLATENAGASSQTKRTYKQQKRGWKGVKKYSARWWQLYRAQERRKANLAKRKRALRLRQLRLARSRQAKPRTPRAAASANPVPNSQDKQALLPSGDPAPPTWRQANSSASEMTFRVDNGSGNEVGSAAISVVGPATGESVVTGRNRTVGGVPTTSLRREVINRMVKENGWVVNDFQKQIDGKPVYVVVAQSQSSDGRVQSRMFYFAESEGRIYSVATNASADSADRLAEESERVIRSIQSRERPAQQASNKD